MAGEFDPKAYENARKNADKLLKRLEDTNKQLKQTKAIWDGISTTIFEISGASWWDKVPKTAQQIEEEAKNYKKIKEQVDDMSAEVSKKLLAAFKDVNSSAGKLKNSFKEPAQFMKEQLGSLADSLKLEEYEKLYGILKSSGEITESKIVEQLEKAGIETNKIQIDAEKFKNIREEILSTEKKSSELLEEILENNDSLNKIQDKQLLGKILLAENEDEMRKILENNLDSMTDIAAAIEDQHKGTIQVVQDLKVLTKKADDARAKMKEMEREVFSIGKGLQAIGNNIASKILPRMMEFDKVIHDVQRDTGIQMVENAAKMTELTSKSAQFGLSIEETGKMMAELAEELRTIDFDLVAGAAKDFVAISKATGAASEDVTRIAGEMMRMGASSEEVKQAMADANVQANRFGVSSKKVIAGLSKNLEKMRQFGFTGGIESLTKMTAQAERLRIQVDSIFNVAERARNIEGAMEMAAELQLAGGSFSNINPMDLLAAARSGPEELGKILTQMGGDIGRFNKETGQYEFDPVDSDRLRIVAKATGMELDDIQKMIQKNAEDNKKLDMFPKEMFNIDGLKPEEVQSMISDSLEIGKDGTIKVKEGNIFGAGNVEELLNMSKKDMKAKIDQKKADKENLEKQAQENMALKESFDNLVNSLINFLTIFQPAIEWLGSVFQSITSFFQDFWLPKWILGGLLVVGALSKFIPMMVGSIGKMSFGISNLGKVFKAGGVENAMQAKNLAGKGGIPPAVDKGAKGAMDLASKEKAVPRGAGGGIKTFLTNLAEGLKSFGKGAGEVIKGAATLALSMALILAPFTLFVWAISSMGVSPELLIASGLAVAGLAGAIWIASKAGTGIDLKGIMQLGIALGAIGIGILAFSAAAVLLSSGINWGAVLIGVGILTAVTIALGLLGMLFPPLMPGIKAAALGLAAVGAALLIGAAALLVLSQAIQPLSEVDWSFAIPMGVGLMAIAGGLMLFALAGLMFLNPIIWLGMILMIGALSELAAVMAPLSEAMAAGSSGFDKMASGIEKLNAAVQSLDFDKLEKLGEISQGLAMAAAFGGSALVDGLAKFAEALGGGKGAGGAGTAQQPIIIQLKLPNGRTIEQVRVDDINKVS